VQVSINKGYIAVLKDLNPKGLAVGETNIINSLTKKVRNFILAGIYHEYVFSPGHWSRQPHF
jgi:hypothetical protein